MIARARILLMLAVATGWSLGAAAHGAAPSVDLAGYKPECGVLVVHEANALRIEWSVENGESARVILDFVPGQPLIRSIAIGSAGQDARVIIEGADPVTFLLVGSRQAPRDRPPTMSVFNTFFDAPANRPFASYRSSLDLSGVRVTSHGQRASVVLAGVALGPFTGELKFTIYAGSPLLHVETIVHTREDHRAILYDSGLALTHPESVRFSYLDTEGRWQQPVSQSTDVDRPLKVRHRALIAETKSGSLACFPPPHQFFFARDLTDNLSTVWYGRQHRGLEPRFGFGIRQSERGGGAFAPWFNAPPNTDQRLGVFYLISSGDSHQALDQTSRFTHGDRFARLPGYRTLTTHWHMATAVAAMKEIAAGTARSTPDFVSIFKNMGVDIVHLAEFHGDGHPADPGPVRLIELRAMFDECRRLSDETLLFLPGEEANNFLGRPQPGKQGGHWIYLFPRPVYWTMNRSPRQPFLETVEPFGTVYHVGDRNEMLTLLEHEHGLAWTSHPRIKASSWTPDIFRQEDFYLSNRWLGAAWKAVPSDLSHHRLGRRALDLLDDMANWGQEKYLPAEVDVFKIDHTHELYGHMNINYVALDPDRLPRFGDGWQPVLDALRAGRFFVSTGEVLIPQFRVADRPGGSHVTARPDESVDVRAELSWTFPLEFIELISGDGQKVFRQRLETHEVGAFQKKSFQITAQASGRKWLRLEAWDIAGNGAFTQPVWLTSTPTEPKAPTAGIDPARKRGS
jgi:hypothetical protein